VCWAVDGKQAIENELPAVGFRGNGFGALHRACHSLRRASGPQFGGRVHLLAEAAFAAIFGFFIWLAYGDRTARAATKGA
jgi:hypothetical protein